MGIDNWAVSYAEDPDLDTLMKFDLVVLDPQKKRKLSRRGKKRPLFLGYVSIGEVEETRPYYKKFQGKSFILDKNPDWDSYFVDVRDPAWQAFILDELVPEVLAKGYDGLFLDTLDTAEYLEEHLDAQKYKGSREAMITLVSMIRKKYPGALICINRGLEMWDQMASVVNAVLFEDFATVYDFKAKKYTLLKPEEIRENIARVSQMKKDHPEVMILTLDYVHPGDCHQAARVAGLAELIGVFPYLSDIDLTTVYTYTLKKQ